MQAGAARISGGDFGFTVGVGNAGIADFKTALGFKRMTETGLSGEQVMTGFDDRSMLTGRKKSVERVHLICCQ